MSETEKNFRITQYKAESETVFIWFPTTMIQYGKSNFRREGLSQLTVPGTARHGRDTRARILCTLRSSEQGKQALCFASFTCSVQEQRRNGGWVFLLNTVKIISHGHTQEPYQVALDSVKLTVSADQHRDSIKGINKGNPKRIKHSQECRAGLQ